MTPTLNGHTGSKPPGAAQGSLAALAGRLTDPEDRETYAALISYFDSLPPGDDLSQFARLLGFLTLLGQHIPDAMAEFLEAFREETKAAAECNARVEDRLAGLPKEIAAGVDPGEIAKKMSESFRQQIAASGLRESAALLDAAAKETRALAGEVTATLKPALQEFRRVASTVAAELAKLVTASRQVQDHNARLMEQERRASWLWIVVVTLVVFLAGGLCGLLFEKGQTTDALAVMGDRIQRMDAQIQRIQTPAAPAPAMVKLPPGTTQTQSQRRMQ